MKVLVIEDSEQQAALLSTFLSRLDVDIQFINPFSAEEDLLNESLNNQVEPIIWIFD
ncbi:hypothetical protein KC678_05375 [Candidatus Dojkabacteria bacterium]|uniref:Uncharacterized protein n=1 Tax=Candidatus Dojkabacteria bacterium TaxID=2099670 RepID=A0A955RGX5_9BACT|nr:hypothetical protein [Candidatus Dojkabacteria bacterium]